MPGSPSCGTLFDIPAKTAARDQLEAKQAEPDFWNNQERARATIQQLKVANALLKPYEELKRAADDLKAMAELAEEDDSFEAELAPELERAEHQYEAFELQAMMSGKQDAANAIVSIKPGAGGTDACDFAEILYRMYTRWAQKHDFTVEEQKRLGDVLQRYDAKGEIAFGSQIRSYVLQPYTLVRDERAGIDVKTPAVMQVLDGDLDEFMHAYLRYMTAKRNKAAKK